MMMQRASSDDVNLNVRISKGGREREVITTTTGVAESVGNQYTRLWAGTLKSGGNMTGCLDSIWLNQVWMLPGTTGSSSTIP